jgi:AcrR family transcriptional regulator
MGRYHHGDLKAALIDATIELIRERGVREFSMAEVTRRSGVAVSAPYRHFADRDELLVAVAIRASDTLSEALATETRTAKAPADRLAAAARGYVRFAAHNRPLFEALVNAGLDKSRHPELERSSRSVAAAFFGPAQELSHGEKDTGEDLALAIAAAAHGLAVLLLAGAFGPVADAVDDVAARASGAALALVRGRKALHRGP